MTLAGLTNSISLRHVVLADGIISGAMGVLLFAASGPLSGLLGLPAAFLFWAGIALMPWMAALVLIARKDRMAGGAVETVIALNALWVLASIAVIVLDPFGLTVLGIAFVAAQALAVTIFADLQFFGLKREG